MGVTEVSMNAVVIAETATGEFCGIGQMIGYSAEPTVVVRQPDGTTMSYAANLCRPATAGEAALLGKLAPSQAECDHQPIYGRLSFTVNSTVCARCKKAVHL